MSIPTARAPRPGLDRPDDTWTGRWVAERLGVGVETTGARVGVALRDLVGLAVRRNPRRAQLLVSTVLGKHVPTDPRLVYGSGLLLGALAAEALTGAGADVHRAGNHLRDGLYGAPGAAGRLLDEVREGMAAQPPAPAGTVVLGYAETATALGHAVADALRADYLHSTRRTVPGSVPTGGFEEEHSHATGHLLLPEDGALLTRGGPLVLVDDELSTGQTVLNTITALHARAPRDRYVIAALVDLRSDADRARLAARARELGVRIDVVALAAGRIDLPGDVLVRGQELVARTEAGAGDPGGPGYASGRRPGRPPVRRAGDWPAGVRDGGRHGFGARDAAALTAASAGHAATLAAGPIGPRVLVLGVEELMYAPLRIAVDLAARLGDDADVRYSTTTRSPVLAVDDPGYAIRTRLTFPAHDDPADGPGPRFAYNVAPGADGTRRFSDVVLVADVPADTPALHAPGGLVDLLTGCADRVHLVVLPSHRPAPRKEHP